MALTVKKETPCKVWGMVQTCVVKTRKWTDNANKIDVQISRIIIMRILFWFSPGNTLLAKKQNC